MIAAFEDFSGEITYCSGLGTLQKGHGGCLKSYRTRTGLNLVQIGSPTSLMYTRCNTNENLTTYRGPASSWPQNRGTCCSF